MAAIGAWSRALRSSSSLAFSLGPTLRPLRPHHPTPLLLHRGTLPLNPHLSSPRALSFCRPFSSSSDGSGWADRLKSGWEAAGEKAREAVEAVSPYYAQVVDSHPFVKDAVAPVGYTLAATAVAWFVMPGIFKRIHRYAMRTRLGILSSGGVDIPYERSFWGALEDPVRYLVTFFAFSQIGMLVAPTSIAQYMGQVWRGAAIVSLIWFLQRWKSNAISRALASPNMLGIDREKILTLDSISSVGLFVVGLMASAEACGVAVQSILTVGGIGGVATAFAARDVLGNILSGLSMQFSQPFTVGDTIKAGSVEGQVVKMGLTSTSLLTAEKFPVVVPNSLFSSQAIVNKSRAEWRAIITKVPLTMNSLDKVANVSSDVKNMLEKYEHNLMLKEPYCFLSGIGSSSAELTIAYSLKYMSKDKLYSMEQDILLQSVEIIKKHGAELGSSWQS